MIQYHYFPEGMLSDTEGNRQNLASAAAFMRAAESGAIMESHAVLCDADHNLTVELPGMIGTIPRGEAAIGLDSGVTREIAVISRVGKPVSFKVLSVRESGGTLRAILSRRAAQEEALNYMMTHLVPGDVVPARVTHLEPFGAFVDLGCGIISFIGIENISVSRLSHPSDRFRAGQDIYAVVTAVDPSLRRIHLTHKELLGTWEQNAALFSPGETVRGIIRDTPEYGVFVELTPNLSGLAERRPGLTAGMPVSVYIKSILPERMKIKLIVIDRLDVPPAIRPLTYYLPESGRLAHWVYTPDCCAARHIETVFGSEKNKSIS